MPMGKTLTSRTRNKDGSYTDNYSNTWYKSRRRNRNAAGRKGQSKNRPDGKTDSRFMISDSSGGRRRKGPKGRSLLEALMMGGPLG